MLSLKMERIRITSASPGYMKVSEIGKELIAFSTIIDEKYNQIDFEFGFCFRALYSTEGIRSKVQFFKDPNWHWLGMDLIMPLDEFDPYKNNVSMQRLIMGKHFFPFFTENIKKYKNKLPTLKSVAEDLTEDMRLFLIDNLWLKDDKGKLKLSVIETIPCQQAVALFGNPTLKKFTDNEQGQKEQDLLWIVDENIKLSAKYTLVDKIWELRHYSVDN
jgi:hypothetical protein